MNASSESPNLDFLRSAAVIFVTAFHLQLLFEKRQSPYVAHLQLFHSIGNWGVLIFFVHTSLVLMFSLERQRLRFEGAPAYLPFMVKRVFRIYPLSVFIVLLVTTLRLPVAEFTKGTLEAVHLHWTGVLANLLLLQNLTHTDSVIVPLWSLPYEMQMYLFLPFLFLLVYRTRRAWPVLVLWMVAVFGGMHSARLEKYGFPDFILYIPYFLSGVFAYSLSKSWKLKIPAYLWPVAIALLTAAYLERPVLRNSWFCCLALGLLIPQFKEITNLVVRKTFHTIARYSYGIYLTHFISLWLAFQAFSSIPLWSRWTIFLVTLVAFPYFSYHVIEQPMIDLGEKVATTLRQRLVVPLRVTA
jgi:peptidoglycan/LPS O-acetylase OafA/YrhL